MEKFNALSEEKQTKIRNSALSCFAKHGYEKASINDIAVTAGVSKASIFQYFGSKQALYAYLLDYCISQMKQAYDRNRLDEDADFFDRVWTASAMKVENLKKHPYVASFIASAVAEQAFEPKESASFMETLVFREEDSVKFKQPDDVATVLQLLFLVAHGMAYQLENGMDYDDVMSELDGILKMLKRSLYKEEYLHE